MRKSALSLAFAVVFIGAALPFSTFAAASNDTAAINALYQKFLVAFRSKNLDGIMSVYAPGSALFVFDVNPPREHRGWADYRNDWKGVFDAYTGNVTTSIQELTIAVSGDVTYTRFVEPVTGVTKHGKTTVVVRVTDVLRKVGGKWLIVQEHVSVPVDLDTGKSDVMSRP